MRWWSRVLITSFFTAGIAFLLSLLPAMDNGSGVPIKDLHVFGSNEVLQLEDSNIVDFMLRTPLNLDIKKVDVGHTTLWVDLQVGKKQLHPPLIYRDLYEMAYTGFNETANVQQILIRVLDEQQLLVAMNAKREAMFRDKQQAASDAQVVPEQFIAAHFELTYTPRWDQLVR